MIDTTSCKRERAALLSTKTLEDQSRLPETLKKYFSVLWSATFNSFLSTEVEPQERQDQHMDVAADSEGHPLWKKPLCCGWAQRPCCCLRRHKNQTKEELHTLWRKYNAKHTFLYHTQGHRTHQNSPVVTEQLLKMIIYVEPYLLTPPITGLTIPVPETEEILPG